MKRLFSIIHIAVLSSIPVTIWAQPATSTKVRLQDILKIIEDNRSGGLISDSTFSVIRNKLFKDPELYNSAWRTILESGGSGKFDFLRDLNIRFKTFEATDSNRVSLGFAYDWNLSFTNQKNQPGKNSSVDFKLQAAGNLAFNRKFNPADFLSTRLVFNRQAFGGGFVNKTPLELRDSILSIRRQLAAIEDDEEVKRSPLWGRLMNYFRPRNHYYVDLNVSGGLETNQDFTSKQWAYGLQAAFSIKSYHDENPLSQLNIVDYPFALIRKLTGTDERLTPYGAAFPLLMAGLDYVKPTQDPVRKQLTGDLNGFARFFFETGFRTLVVQTAGNTIYFNADFRVYKELNPPAQVKQANLDQFIYFTSSLTSNKGLFVSYSNGHLPFDARADGIYEVGIHYRF